MPNVALLAQLKIELANKMIKWAALCNGGNGLIRANLGSFTGTEDYKRMVLWNEMIDTITSIKREDPDLQYYVVCKATYSPQGEIIKTYRVTPGNVPCPGEGITCGPFSQEKCNKIVAALTAP